MPCRSGSGTSFGSIASKENGIDAEGLAVRDQKLYIGFRGPVLRGNFTPILRCRFGSPITEPEVLFVSLGGRGVRDRPAHLGSGSPPTPAELMSRHDREAAS